MPEKIRSSSKLQIGTEKFKFTQLREGNKYTAASLLG